jgi:quercetin dioxygenase-like cupin family protein
MKSACLLLAVLCIGSAVSVSVGDETAKAAAKAPIMQSFATLKWSALPERPGMEFAVLSGDPKSGSYTQIRKVPAGTSNPIHSHSSDLTNVIISGTWYTGADDASAKDFGPGSVIFMPGNWIHVSGCRPGSECVFYQDGKGKFDFKAAATQHAP